jgi:exodeoxyribonuclease VII large subunit
LIDFAADLRAPTPTAAAELAVPVRLDLLASLDALTARLSRAVATGLATRGQRMRDLSRALPRVDSLTAPQTQRLDLWSGRLAGALGLATAKKRSTFERAARLRPETLTSLIARRRDALQAGESRLTDRAQRGAERRHAALDKWASRLAPALSRLLGSAARDIARDREKLGALHARLNAAPDRRFAELSRRLDQIDRTRLTLGHLETLKRGFAIVRGDGHVLTTRSGAEKATALEIEFADGKLALGPRPSRKGKADPGPDQGSLF